VAIFTPTPETVEAGTALSISFLNRRWVMLIPYAVFLLIFAVLSGYALRRIWQIKIKGDATGTVIIVFAVLAVLLLLVTFAYGLTVDWGKNIF